MTRQEPEILRDRGRDLEDEFFRREDQRLIERLNELKAKLSQIGAQHRQWADPRVS